MTIAEDSGAPAAVPPNSPPTKASLANWWERFKKRNGKDNGGKEIEPQGIFGIPLNKSINYANVAISLTDLDGGQFVYGYVPIVVAKCGVFLKEKATEIEGIFRLSGSAKRIKDLQTIFDSPERYGKGLDWTGYTVHDAANVLRRYLNQLPEPIIPLDFYNKFRDPLTVQPKDFDDVEAIKIYQRLISELPPLSRQLLLYILDLLAVFASKSEMNRMNAENLAAIFQPGLISHPSHEMAPQAYKLSQDVLVFLINHQDHFLLGMRGSNDGQGGPELNTPVAPTSLRYSKMEMARTPSNPSAAADDVRKYGGLRRNASVNSKKSGGHGAKSGGVSRSNTLPSKRSPRTRPMANFLPTDGSVSPKPAESIGTVSTVAAEGGVQVPPPIGQMTENMSMVGTTRPENPELLSPKEGRSRQVSGSSQVSSATTLPKERNFANIFSLAPGDSDRPQRKLRKKRIPGSNDHSAESSTTSLPFGNSNPNPSEPPLGTVPGPSPNSTIVQPIPLPTPTPNNTGTTSTSTLMPTMSPTPSATSSVTSQDSNHSYSDATNNSASIEKGKKARSRWRWSNSKVDQWNPGSPTFNGSTSSIAERMRGVSRSPPVSDRKASSDGSGDDESRSNRSRLSWLKKRERRSQEDRDIPIHVQVQQLPPPQYSTPSSPQVQPPTPLSSQGKPTPIAEETEDPHRRGLTWAPHTGGTAPPVTAAIDRNRGLTPRSQTPEHVESPDISPDSDVTQKPTVKSLLEPDPGAIHSQPPPPPHANINTCLLLPNGTSTTDINTTTINLPIEPATTGLAR